ncbi:MAG: DUF1887 family protein [Prevotellaceae bacterium]|jgi:hypothetical protein|nr:DUF1887 family protein [Prevotellaceae bacterium]
MKTIVNIISEQATPNFLFIKEKIQLGDELFFISSKKFEERIDWLEKSLKYNNCVTHRIIFDKIDTEEHWQEMVSLIQNKISHDKEYIVNLTGGTKYMTLAAHYAFSKMSNAEFYYIPFPKNSILKIESNDISPLLTRINICEYLTTFNVSFSHKEITKSKKYTEEYFKYFTEGKLNFKLIDLLREKYRNKSIDIHKKETEEGTEKTPQLIGLSQFLVDIKFPLEKEEALSKYEIQYITGGWFEEYIYNKIKEEINPDDIKLGVNITRAEKVHNNDLDVVFTYENKLFVIECKTGIDGQKMFNETVYKAVAIKEVLLGISANTLILSLASESENLTKIAKVMGIEYFGRSYFVDDNKFSDIINLIKSKAK